MSDYNRTTRECSASQLHPELFLTIRNYFQEHKLGDLETEALACYETTSRKKSGNGLGAWLSDGLDTTIHTGILLTSQRLIWVRNGDKSGAQLASADLKQISVRVYASLFTRDTGLEISGHMEDSKGVMRGYIAMGSAEAAQKLSDEVNQAIIKVNPPAPKNVSKWRGGMK